MTEIVALFKEQDTRDELGIASIRDGFADMFFPGTTTLQTRARYFLFVPWLYRHYENTWVPSARIQARLLQDEIALINALVSGGETSGVIGQRSGSHLQRFPSNIYWIGLQTFGICRFPGTQDQYHRSLDYWYVQKQRRSDADEKNSYDRLKTNWDLELPEKPAKFPSEANFALTKKEAKYLQERLNISCRESLLTYLVNSTQPIDDEVRFPWFHPAIDVFPAHLKNWLTHARNFSEAMHGAALLYNLKLAELKKNEEWITLYQEELKEWYLRMRSRQAAWQTWNRSEFWLLLDAQGVHVPALSRVFVNEWLDALFFEGKIQNPEKNKELGTLVRNREQFLKGARSRFTSQRHLEIWNGASSAGQLEFRWGIGRRIANDILNGLNKGENHNAVT